MRIDQNLSVPASVDEAWAILIDIPRVAGCVPGVEGVEPIDNDRYRGLMKVRVGPIGLALEGEVTVVQLDPASRTAKMHAEATDRRAAGAVRADVTMTVEPEPAKADSARLIITTDAQVLGKIGEFGQPIIRRKADQVLAEFGQNLAQLVAKS
jgi:carbon monoxide dehydrogenase subunit G